MYCKTVATISSIHQHTVLQFFFLVMRTFKVYSLSNIQIYNTVLLTKVTILYTISQKLFIL